jgi:DNA-binding NtrC family response regulator
VFEAAQHGTLFLDEVHNASLETQKQLLLVLQDRRVRPLGGTRELPVDVKVIAASNVRLEQAVADGRFRSDLYMRLSPATRVEIPPLRERPSDLRYLAASFAELAVAEHDLSELRARLASALGLPREAALVLRFERDSAASADHLALQLPHAAWKMLEAHAWPGNLRELASVMQNIVTFSLVAAVDALAAGLAMKSQRLQVDPGLVAALLAGSRGLHKPSVSEPQVSAAGLRVQLNAGRTLNAVAKDVERQYMLALFSASSGSFADMAEKLLGDKSRTRAIRLRFNQLGLKVRALRRS